MRSTHTQDLTIARLEIEAWFHLQLSNLSIQCSQRISLGPSCMLLVQRVADWG